MFLIAEEALTRENPSWTATFGELLDLEGDGSWCGRFDGELLVVVQRERIRVAGTLQGEVPRECDLCLGHYLEPVTAAIEDLCVVGSGAPAEAVFDEDSEVWRVAPEGRLSLTELARQAVLLALPTRARCGDDCPARERFEQSQPSSGQIDPRLAVLREILEPEVEDDGGPEEED
ncbi:MAG: DUF177 domain-containing protein [Armatimonadetes bacterium]|nr:DUF177 domain-containing protein [Armatimonadota bacterium]